LCLLAAFPDRLARRRSPHQPELDMANSSSVKMGPQSQATEAMLLLVLDAEERRDGKLAQTQVRLAHGIDPTLLLETFAADLQEAATWELRGDRVVQRQQTTLFGLVIEEQERTAPPGSQTAAVLVPALLKQGGGQVPDAQAWTQLRERLAFAAAQGAPLPVLDDAHMEAMLLQACQTLSRLSEAKSLDLPGVVRASLAGAAEGQGLALLERYAPEHMTLPGGRKLRIQYEADKPPWTSSRLQDFFGLAQGPRVADGKVPVVLHLLAPNQRPVQLTSDLAGFWQRHYPAVRKELMRKYPRHLWPDNPLDAAPPPPNRPR
jgi:ATP-dependent helicase HrpB